MTTQTTTKTSIQSTKMNMSIQIPERKPEDVVGQFTFLNGYSHVIYGYEIPVSIARKEVIAALETAMDQVLKKVPWLGGQIAEVDGTWQPCAWPSTGAAANTVLRIHECDDEMPSMYELLEAEVPVSQLPSQVLTPWPSLPAAHGLSSPLPALVLQANFIRGGLLLNVTPHHIAMDGSGLMQVLALLGTALRGHDISASDVEQAHRDRRRVIPLLAPYEPVRDYSHLVKPAGFVPRAPSSTPQWCYYKMPLRALATLRKMCQSKSLPVSDNDIICAFCWQRISATRVARGVAPTHMVKFTRAVDGRSVLGVPFSYIGHMVHHAIANLALGDVASAQLLKLAQLLRRELNAVNTSWAFRSYATYVAMHKDKSRLVFGGLRDVNLDLGATSVVATASDEAGSSPGDGFGILGQTKFIRRPYVTPITGTITVTPAENGALPIAMCLPEVDLKALRLDTEWQRFTKYIG